MEDLLVLHQRSAEQEGNKEILKEVHVLFIALFKDDVIVL